MWSKITLLLEPQSTQRPRSRRQTAILMHPRRAPWGETRACRPAGQDAPRRSHRTAVSDPGQTGDRPLDVGRGESGVGPPEAIEIPPPALGAFSRQQDGLLGLGRCEALEPRRGAIHVVLARVQTKHRRPSASRIALSSTLLELVEPPLLRGQSSPLRFQVRSNPPDVAHERAGTGTAIE